MILRSLVFLLLFYFCLSNVVQAQVLNTGMPYFEEKLRRWDLTGRLDSELSFLIRPIDYRQIEVISKDSLENNISFFSKSKTQFSPLPIQLIYRYNQDNLTVFGDGLMIPAAGHQAMITSGFYLRLGIFNVNFQPEFIIAENRAFQGFPFDFNAAITTSRFIYWNNGDFPERFGQNKYSKVWWGQSKIGLTGKQLEFYAGTQNISWGPGQFNNLIFSNNAPGFLHLSLNTVNPIKTPIGGFEAQVISGRLENSFENPSQNQVQNQNYFIPFESEWRYLNGFSISYQPKWLKGMYFGLNRTFQINNNLLGNSLKDYFPVFEVFQKEEFFQNGNSLIYDQKGTDQQVSVFSKIVLRKAMAEFYFEFGRRDHAFNWREFILNPEHARAYLIGFNKLVKLDSKSKFLQFRGEIVQQHESVNRYIRYLGLGGNLTWHTHGTARGFTNFGQALGVGIGVGSNSQIAEISIVEDDSKVGVMFSRIENNQDFYYRAFGQIPNTDPWVDFGLGLIYQKEWYLFTILSKVDLVYAKNRQWESNINPSPTFSSPQGAMSTMVNFTLFYQLNRHKND